ncbi:uncharacterized protein LOC132722828, partial [Ruditapes philippinarum]|uniref:uncharacterized protein LOC132722828 n=1 Tax=Ruditapes philippinarum TaxID=129788 RepID=UPI00295B3F2E
MRILVCTILLLNYLLMFANSEKPHCSKYDFEEKVLEKMVRMEFQMERMKTEMEQTVKSVDRKLNEIDEKVEALQNKTVESVDRKLNEIDEKEAKNSYTIKTTQEKFSEKIEVLQNKTSEIIATELKELQILKDRIETPTVAFKASLNTHTVAAPVGQVIVFPTVLFNEGDAYSRQTGKFTATKGTYLFTIALCLYSNKHLFVDIMVDGVAYTKTYIQDQDDLDCDTADTVAVLKAGQSVWVQPSGSTS